MDSIAKYPRTRHLEGSGLQADDDPITASWSELANQWLVIEEKMDGANCGIRFDSDGQLRLQSRGHYLTGGPRERQFDLLKSWAHRYRQAFWELLGKRYILYGEWCYAKHSIFYTDLPHYFLEFDILDTTTGLFCSTPQRQQLLQPFNFIVSVAVLYSGTLPSLTHMQAMIGRSRFIAEHQREQLIEAANSLGLDSAQIIQESDLSGLMEGLYIKVEDPQHVVARYKYVRRSFLQTVLDSGNHWMNRPLLPNRLQNGIDVWSTVP